MGGYPGMISFHAREEAVVAGVEEVLRLFDKFSLGVVVSCRSGQAVAPEEVFLQAFGRAADLHAVWKVAANVLEHCSGIATRTRRLVRAAQRVNPRITVLTTRKLFPGTKEMAVRAVAAGGGWPHRLGLSETILIFKQHLCFLGGVEGLAGVLDAVRARACEKKIIVEVEDADEAARLCRAGVDGLQFDKVPARQLKDIVGDLRRIAPAVTLLAAGGIDQENVAEYAGTGVDALVTSWVYFGRPVDMGVRITGV